MSSPATAPGKADALADKYDGIVFDDTPVVKYGDTPGWEILRRVAEPVTDFADPTLTTLIAEMREIMYSAHGVGLAAPQVNRSIRLLVYDAGDGFRTLLNPTIIKKKGDQFEPEEGCLSIPGLRGVVRRASEIVIKAQEPDGKHVQFKAKDFEARILLHEVDHLNGVLFIDLADPATLHMLTPAEDRGEVGNAPPKE
ncbi:MAG: peptide deformylase [Armatimonadetes bacterium]|nr:peptide deformylase [Armatimonadota bacterium]